MQALGDALAVGHRMPVPGSWDSSPFAVSKAPSLPAMQLAAKRACLMRPRLTARVLMVR